MKRIQLFSLLLLAGYISADAQIFINTGNPNIDKYKQENPNAAIWNATKDSSSVKTPAVKVQTTTTPPATSTTLTAPGSAPASSPKAEVKMETQEYTGNLSEANNNLPPNAEVGKCYARCFVADQYEFKEETVIDKPVSYKTRTIPATYKIVFDTVTVKPASTRYEEVPAVYETVVEDIMVSPATQKWVKSVADAGCLSANPADCQVMCLQQVPAVYKKTSRKVLKTPAIKQEFPVPAEYKIVSRQVIDQPSRTEQIEIPATYKKVAHKELIRKGGYSEWKEILCANKLTSSKIIAIQTALKNAGYNPGALDDVFGAQTKTALIKYQQDKNLPVGNLNMETLKSLGVE